MNREVLTMYPNPNPNSNTSLVRRSASVALLVKRSGPHRVFTRGYLKLLSIFYASIIAIHIALHQKEGFTS